MINHPVRSIEEEGGEDGLYIIIRTRLINMSLFFNEEVSKTHFESKHETLCVQMVNTVNIWSRHLRYRDSGWSTGVL